MSNYNWSPTEIKRIFELHDSGLTWAEVARAVGRSESSVVWKAKTLRAAGLAETTIWRRNVPAQCVTAIDEGSIVIPAHVLTERAARLQARRLQSATSLFLGDPPPGFSALDYYLRRPKSPSFLMVWDAGR